MKYLDMDVYQALLKRLDVVFGEFDNVCVAFSGGKDSGLLLNLCLQYIRERKLKRRIGVFHQDFEAQYTETTKYVERTLTHDNDLIRPYWTCMPISCKTATSMYEQYWIPWDDEKQDLWVRPMPGYDCVINLKNHQFDFYSYAIKQEELYTAFTPWFHHHECGGKGRTVSLTGIRMQESLNRWRAINNITKTCYKKHSWTTKVEKNVYIAHPIYDWLVDDVWIANAKFEFDYNRIYDLFYEAGISIHEMRVASPFNDWAIKSLKLYRVLEPDIWGAVSGRVQGANFSALYGGTKAVAWKSIQLPKGHTWKSYVDFLLTTLPEEVRRGYEKKFKASIEFWRKKGGVLSSETITELRAMGIPVKENGKSNYRSDKTRVIFEEYPDDLDVKAFQTVPTYKRMAICILKNDHLCKYMGFSPSQEEEQRRANAVRKYQDMQIHPR